MPIVTVIIPTHNDGAFIEEAVQSVLNQTFQDFEIIIVNDGSTDNTEQQLAKYQHRIIYHYQTCRGPAASRNWAVHASNCPLIAFLDADDLWLPTKLEKQMRFASENPQYGIITTDVEWFNEHGVINSSLKFKYPLSNGVVLEQLVFYNWITTSAALVRRECFGQAGWFDEERGIFGEDWMMWVKIAAHYPIHFLDEVLTKRRVRSDSFENQDPEAQFRNLFRNLEKLQSAVPELAGRSKLFREAAYRICVQRGKRDLQHLNPTAARRKLSQAIRYRPFRLRPWLLLFASYLPTRVVIGIRKAKHVIRVIHTTSVRDLSRRYLGNKTRDI